jgi:Co/Zn/Cd efflux system component
MYGVVPYGPLELTVFCRLEPPEMNTSQLLLVSSVGLGVNLFGMFAMGGHHHVSSARIFCILLHSNDVYTLNS